MKKTAIIACFAALVLCLAAFAGCTQQGNSSDAGSKAPSTTASTPTTTKPEQTKPESSEPEKPDPSEPETPSEPENPDEPETPNEPETPSEPTTPSGKGAEVAALAKTLVDKPFELGAAGPDKFDNSGLVYYCFKQKGIDIPRRTGDMFKAGTAVEMKDLQPGDVVFYSMETEGNAQYAGIYVGDGQFVAANNPDSPSSLQTMSWKYFTDRFVGARRY